MSNGVYRKLTLQDMRDLLARAESFSAREEWITTAREVYGPDVARLVIRASNEYDDEGSYYWMLNGLTVYDAENHELQPQLQPDEITQLAKRSLYDFFAPGGHYDFSNNRWVEEPSRYDKAVAAGIELLSREEIERKHIENCLADPRLINKEQIDEFVNAIFRELTIPQQEECEIVVGQEPDTTVPDLYIREEVS